MSLFGIFAHGITETWEMEKALIGLITENDSLLKCRNFLIVCNFDSDVVTSNELDERFPMAPKTYPEVHLFSQSTFRLFTGPP